MLILFCLSLLLTRRSCLPNATSVGQHHASMWSPLHVRALLALKSVMNAAFTSDLV